jgi:hypothetical protein
LPANDRHAVPAVVPHGAKAIARKEKLHFQAHIWYKVSRSERVSYNGITPASQADNEGSIPFTRSTIFKASSLHSVNKVSVKVSVSGFSEHEQTKNRYQRLLDLDLLRPSCTLATGQHTTIRMPPTADHA